MEQEEQLNLSNPSRPGHSHMISAQSRVGTTCGSVVLSPLGWQEGDFCCFSLELAAFLVARHFPHFLKGLIGTESRSKQKTPSTGFWLVQASPLYGASAHPPPKNISIMTETIYPGRSFRGKVLAVEISDGPKSPAQFAKASKTCSRKECSMEDARHVLRRRPRLTSGQQEPAE